MDHYPYHMYHMHAYTVQMGAQSYHLAGKVPKWIKSMMKMIVIQMTATQLDALLVAVIHMVVTYVAEIQMVVIHMVMICRDAIHVAVIQIQAIQLEERQLDCVTDVQSYGIVMEDPVSRIKYSPGDALEAQYRCVVEDNMYASVTREEMREQYYPQILPSSFPS